MLQLQSLTKNYQSNGSTVHALQDVSLQVEAGQFCALQGPSGCGKSTLLLAAGGLLRPDTGQVIVDGNDLYAMSPDERAAYRARNIGFVFQQFHLVPYLSVLENVLAASLGVGEQSGDETRQRACDLIDQVGLSPRASHRPGQLSTGERQRTALARALLNQPRILLADEPTGNLDESNALVVLEHLERFANEGGAVLLVTHDQRAAASAHLCRTMAEGTMVDD